MKFKYKGRNKAGVLQQGIVEASSTRSAQELLVRNGLSIIKLKEIKEIPIISGVLRIWEGVRPKEFVIFSRQLATLIDSKVPLLTALHSIANQTENRFFAIKLNSVIVDIDGGSSFSEALSKHPDVFSNFGIDPKLKKLLVVKSTNHFHDAFSQISNAILYASVDGPYPNKPETNNYTNLIRKIWPRVKNPHD